MERFELGTSIAIRTHRFGRLRTAKAAILVEDSDETISYWWPAGARWLVTEAMTTPRDDMFSETLAELTLQTWTTTMVPWVNTDVLAMTRPGSWAVIWHMWRHDTGEFLRWYVDLKRPHLRTTTGFDTYDLDLDIVVHPDLSWHWKDEDEFDARRDAGFITDHEAQAARAAGEAIIPLIESAGFPFDGSLEEWRPDPGWPTPLHPDGWRQAPLA